jgi:hypothetical protein
MNEQNCERQQQQQRQRRTLRNTQWFREREREERESEGARKASSGEHHTGTHNLSFPPTCFHILVPLSPMSPSSSSSLMVALLTEARLACFTELQHEGVAFVRSPLPHTYHMMQSLTE